MGSCVGRYEINNRIDGRCKPSERGGQFLILSQGIYRIQCVGFGMNLTLFNVGREGASFDVLLVWMRQSGSWCRCRRKCRRVLLILTAFISVMRDLFGIVYGQDGNVLISEICREGGLWECDLKIELVYKKTWIM